MENSFIFETDTAEFYIDKYYGDKYRFMVLGDYEGAEAYVTLEELMDFDTALLKFINIELGEIDNE